MKLLPALSWILVFHKCLSCSSHTSSHPESHIQLLEFPDFLTRKSAPQWKTGVGLDNSSLWILSSSGYSVVLILFLLLGVRSAVWQFASEFVSHLLIRYGNLALIIPAQQYQSQGILIFLRIYLNFPPCFWALLLGIPPAGLGFQGMLINSSFVSSV